jgi:hypothetical protein
MAGAGPVNPQGLAKGICAKAKTVTSHRNVTAIVDLKPELNPVANIRRPRFSFSLCNCQKTDGNSVKNIHQEPRHPCPNPKTRPPFPFKKLQSEFVGRLQRRRPRW